MGRRRGNSDGPEDPKGFTAMVTPVSGPRGQCICARPPGQARNGTYSSQSDCRDLAEQRAILANVDLEPLIEAVSKPLGAIGPRQRDRAPIVRAHFLAFIHPAKVESVTALHRTLDNDPAFRDVAGFDGPLPSRSTFSRAFREMAYFSELVEKATAEMVGEIRNFIPDLGREVAVDSTPVKSRSNPNHKFPSDPDAVWIRHDKAGAKGGKEWEWGHRLQLAVDANCDVPLWLRFSRENNDSRQMIPLLESMDENLGGLRPDVVLADRGYASKENSVTLYERGIEPVIYKRRPKKHPETGERLHPGGYTTHGVPTCVDWTPMAYVGETDGRYLYRCTAVAEGVEWEQAREHYEEIRVCGGGEDGPGTACRDDVAVDPETNVWLFGGRLRRMNPEWRRLYRKRWSVERVFSQWKGIGRLNAHRFRSHLSMALHVRLQMLAHLATTLTAMLGEI